MNLWPLNWRGVCKVMCRRLDWFSRICWSQRFSYRLYPQPSLLAPLIIRLWSVCLHGFPLCSSFTFFFFISFLPVLLAEPSYFLDFIFQKFNDIIDSSRAEAERAEANIPEIERLINSANNKSDEANGHLSDAQDRADDAQSNAELAYDTANRTQQVSLSTTGW